MNKRVIILLATLMKMFILCSQEMNISLMNQEQALITPGWVNPVFIKFTNNSASDSLQLKIDIPGSWQLIADTGPLLIGPGETMKRMISFFPPENYPAGEKNISFNINSPGNKEISYKKSIRLEIKRLNKVSLEWIDVPSFVVAGEHTSGSFQVLNQGNDTVSIDLTAMQCRLRGEKSILLNPGEIKKSKFDIISSAELKKATIYNISINASINGITPQKTNINKSIRIIPVSETEDDLYHRLPGHAGIQYIGRHYQGKYMYGVQGELFLKGSLDPQNLNGIELLLRGPDQFTLSVLGTYEEYYFRYIRDESFFHVGDQTFNLTRLTESGRFGRGIQGFNKTNRFSAGAYYMKPRFSADIKEEYAAYAGYELSKRNTVQLSYLHNSFNDLDESDIFSSGLKLNPVKGVNLDMELAGSIAGEKKGLGSFTNLNIAVKKLYISAFYLYADKDYRGYYRDTRYYGVNANLTASSKVNIFANLHNDFNNAALDTLWGVAPYSENYRAGANYRPDNKHLISLMVGRQERRDRMLPSQFHYREHNVRLNYNQTSGRFGYLATMEYGRTENLSSQDQRMGDTYNVQGKVNFSPTSRFTIEGFASWSNTNRYSGYQQNFWYYGGSVNGDIGTRVSLIVRYQNNYSIEEYYRDRNFLEMDFRYHFPAGHEFYARGRYGLIRKQVNRTDAAFSVGYRLNLSLPVKKTSEPGKVEGYVTGLDADTTGAIILSLNGHTAVTDSAGYYCFVNIKPGNYFLMIDNKSLPYNHITEIPGPLEINVEAGKTTNFNLGLTRASRIRGHVEYHENNMINLEIPRIIVEVKKGDEVLRMMTEKDGSFNFSGLRPGVWQVRAIINGLEKKMVLEQEMFEISLHPGTTEQVVFDLKARERKIQFVDNSVRFVN